MRLSLEVGQTPGHCWIFTAGFIETNTLSQGPGSQILRLRLGKSI